MNRNRSVGWMDRLIKIIQAQHGRLLFTWEWYNRKLTPRSRSAKCKYKSHHQALTLLKSGLGTFKYAQISSNVIRGLSVVSRGSYKWKLLKESFCSRKMWSNLGKLSVAKAIPNKSDKHRLNSHIGYERHKWFWYCSRIVESPRQMVKCDRFI